MLLLWYLKMLTAHFLTDFVFQPDSWVNGRKKYHGRSVHIYLHTLLTALLASLLTGFNSLLVFSTILITHFFIDLWKSYRPVTILYFFIDQFLHLLVILLLGFALFPANIPTFEMLDLIINNPHYWIYALAIIFLTYPAGIIIGILTAKWRKQIPTQEATLGSAGKWIGILERLIIFVLVVFDQYAAIGLLTAAKSILRFTEGKDAQRRTEYVLIGTLISIATAIIVGLAVKQAIKQ